MQCVCRLLLLLSSLKPGDGTGASSPGQVRVGVHKGGIQVHVKRVCKCTRLEKKTKPKKRTHQFEPP